MMAGKTGSCSDHDTAGSVEPESFLEEGRTRIISGRIARRYLGGMTRTSPGPERRGRRGFE